MLFYADKLRSLDARETAAGVVETLRRAALLYRGPGSPREAALQTHAEVVGASIALGELHQAVADRLNPRVDEVFPELDALATAGMLVGRCVFRSSQVLRARASGDAADLLEAAASAVAGATETLDAAGPLQGRVPEGYAFYCLYPEMYLSSVARALESHGHLPSWTVVGIRSIGTSLAAMVGGALAEMGIPVRVETLRPRGHPFDRYVELGPLLRERLAATAAGGSGFFVVDEGPGLTCSSFLSVCSALAPLGVEEERVVVLSAWRGAPSIYASEEGRRRWRALQVYHTDAEEAFDGWRALLPFVEAALAPGSAEPGRPNETGAPEILDLSYGRWREHLYPSPYRWPVVHRSAERAKLLLRYPSRGGEGTPNPPLPEDAVGGEGGVPAPDGGPPALPAAGQETPPYAVQNGGGRTLLAKFAGLGEYGREKHRRAVALAEAGFAPPVDGLAYGFLLYRFLEEAHPMAASDLSPALLARMARYYGFVARRFPAPPASSFQPLSEMILVNAREALGVDATGYVEAWRSRQQAIDGLPLALIDGKPQPHEWLRVDSPGGPLFLKTDGADHFRDHTLVGEQSILWDLAGACEEWEMPESSRRDFLTLWERETGDRQAAALLDFYRAAYLAFRIAALHYAIHSTDEEEIRLSLQQEQWKYIQRLTPLLTDSRPGLKDDDRGR